MKFHYSGLCKIISGGQCGVDQGALVEAFETNILTGGTAPRGYRVSGGNNQLLRVLGLKQSHSSEYQPRTEQNVKDADATLIIASDLTSPGEVLTLSLCRQHSKPYFVVNLGEMMNSENEDVFYARVDLQVEAAARFIIENTVQVLNVAGNRDTRDQTIMFDMAMYIMREIFAKLDTNNLLLRDSDL